MIDASVMCRAKQQTQKTNASHSLRVICNHRPPPLTKTSARETILLTTPLSDSCLLRKPPRTSSLKLVHWVGIVRVVTQCPMSAFTTINPVHHPPPQGHSCHIPWPSRGGMLLAAPTYSLSLRCQNGDHSCLRFESCSHPTCSSKAEFGC